MQVDSGDRAVGRPLFLRNDAAGSRQLELILTELTLAEQAVEATSFVELPVTPPLRDLAITQYQDFVHGSRCGQTRRDHDRRAILYQRFFNLAE